MDTLQKKAFDQARKFAAAVNKLIGEDRTAVWDAETCRKMAYAPRALAAVVLEGSGVGAYDDTTVLGESGFGRAIELPEMTPAPGIFAEAYSSWLLCFYEI